MRQDLQDRLIPRKSVQGVDPEIQGIRRGIGNQYTNYESIRHPEVGFPGGRSQLFRRAMSEILGLSDDFMNKSMISAMDAAKIQNASVHELGKVGHALGRYEKKITGKSVDVLFVNDPKGGFFNPDKGAKRIFGHGTGPLGENMNLMHELVEYSEYIAIRAGKKSPHSFRAGIFFEKKEEPTLIRRLLGMGPGYEKISTRIGTAGAGRFGSHYSPTVISEERRLAKALGPDVSEAQKAIRTWEATISYVPRAARKNDYAGQAAAAKAAHYASSLRRMGQVNALGVTARLHEVAKGNAKVRRMKRGAPGKTSPCHKSRSMRHGQ